MMTTSENQYKELFEQCRDTICSHSTAQMNAVRDKAYSRFCEVGLPTRKVERFKYSNMQDLFAPDYGLNIKRLAIPANPYDVFKCDVPNLSTALFFMVNDTLVVPKPVNLPEGVIVDSLTNISKTHPEILEKHYAKLAALDNCYGDVAINSMLVQDGLCIYVPENVVVEKTIQIVNILRSDVDMMVNRRVLIVLERGAHVKLLVCDHSSDDQNFLATQVSEIFIGENASLDLYGLEETHMKSNLVTTTVVEQKRNSRLNHNAITLSNGFTRNQLDVLLTEEGAECHCNGCVIADEKQHVDNNTLIDHQASHCQSNELYKYVLDDEAVGAFAGRVLVRKDSQLTTSNMVNQNLCGTKQARMYTQPMLEIYADDVKCSHGSTVGQLNDQAMFYMRQRGISYEEARLLLQTAFIYEVVDQIPLEPLCDRLHHLVDKRFRGELNKCHSCNSCAR